MMVLLFRVVYLGVVAAAIGGCGKGGRHPVIMDAGATEEASDSADVLDGEESAALTPEAGYVTLAERTIRIRGDVSYEGVTCASKLFYSLWPAETLSDEMPLFVVFNGGPSVATSSNLATFGMGASVVDLYGDGRAKPNPNSFTALGNLLFIDTRHVGFSYGLLDDPRDATLREAAYDFVNFSIFTDAGDILLVVLSVLEKHPSLRDNPIVIVAESYGGARAAMIAEYLSRPAMLIDTGGRVADETLAAALKEHFSRVVPETPFPLLTVEETKKQFGWQVLLQPGYNLAPVEIYYRATCSGIGDDDPRAALCAVDPDAHDLRDPDGLNRTLNAGFESVMDPTRFEALFGMPPWNVDGMPARDRFGAFRYADITDSSNFPEWFEQMGDLPAFDTYHLPRLDTGLTSFAFPTAEVATEPFLRSLAALDIFISNAYYDGVIASDRIPDAIRIANERMAVPMLDAVDFDIAPRVGVERPGWLNLVFNDAMGLGDGAARTVRMPLYRNSGHMITLSEPAALREDVRLFLEERGAYGQ